MDSNGYSHIVDDEKKNDDSIEKNRFASPATFTQPPEMDLVSPETLLNTRSISLASSFTLMNLGIMLLAGTKCRRSTIRYQLARMF